MEQMLFFVNLLMQTWIMHLSIFLKMETSVEIKEGWRNFSENQWFSELKILLSKN